MQTFNGIVKSIGSPDSVVVGVTYIFRHPKYLKTLTRLTKLAAHCDIPNLKVGDKVQIIKSRPFSKTKHFKVIAKL